MKKVIYILLLFILISCNQKDKKFYEGSWCISNVNFDITEQKVDSMKLTEVIALSLYNKDVKPTNIIISNDTIKLLLKEEVLDKSSYKIEKKLDNNTFAIIIDNKQSGTISKLEDGYSLKIDYVTYFFKKCQ